MDQAKKLNLRKQFSKPKNSVNACYDTRTLMMDMEKSYPLLRQFLMGWFEGKDRLEGGFLGIFVSADGPKAMLTHTAEDQKAYVTADDLEGLLRTLEEGLDQQTLNWRPSGSSGRNGRKKSGG